MVYKIGNIDEVDVIPCISNAEKQVISKFASILTTEYGKDRDVDHDYGGYILYCSKSTTIEEIKKSFNYDDFHLEYAELYEPDICAALYITSTEFAVILIMSVEDAPDVIKDALPKKIYKVRVNEALSKSVAVEAITMSEAMTIVKEKYDTCEIVLNGDDFAGVSFEEVKA